MSARPALRFHLHRGVGCLVHPDERVRLRGHQVAYQTTESDSFAYNSLGLVEKLPIDGLASADFDAICFVEGPESVGGNLTV